MNNEHTGIKILNQHEDEYRTNALNRLMMFETDLLKNIIPFVEKKFQNHQETYRSYYWRILERWWPNVYELSEIKKRKL